MSLLHSASRLPFWFCTPNLEISLHECCWVAFMCTEVTMLVCMQAVVPRMDSADAGTRQACSAAVHRLFATDAKGVLTQQAVQLLADLVRLRKCRCARWSALNGAAAHVKCLAALAQP